MNQSKPSQVSLPLNSVINGNCIEVMNDLPKKSVDLVFADPPYNLQIPPSSLCRPNNTLVDSVDDSWDKFDSFEAYDDFTSQWLRAARRVLKPNAAIWVIGSYHNVFRLGTALQNLDYWILNDIIWRKPNPMPNFNGTRFTNAHETLIWASRSKKSKVTFNYNGLKSLNDDLQMRSDWEFPICSGRERLKFANGKKVHSTQKPIRLIHRILVGTTNPDDLVLDPFFGTGTTGAAAKLLGRNYIGIERDQHYCAVAQKRLEKISPYDQKSIEITRKKANGPRIPFGMLIELGIIEPGDELTNQKGRIRALVRADGSLACNNVIGSIHFVGKTLEEAPSCNGWTYWYLVQNGKHILIDDFRKKIQTQMVEKNN